MSNTPTRILTGITTSGTPHLGNYVGAIRPAVAASRAPGTQNFYFLADFHALIKVQDPARVQRSTLEIAASWLACGLQPDNDRVWFYRQSDIPETTELTWFLTCVAGKGLLNRAHAYKAAVDRNAEQQQEPDFGVTAGLFMYPVLMAADILIFNAHKVPVGRDQIQHIEMARDFAQRFNHLYGEPAGETHFVLPEAMIEDHVATLPGLDGRKMSKSYDNTIPMFAPREQLKKLIFSIVTDSKLPGEAKDTEGSALFQLYQAFAGADETAAMRAAFADGIGWGDAKQKLFERIDAEIAPLRERYEDLMAKPQAIEEQLREGARTARERLATPFLARLRHAVGLRDLSSVESEVVPKKSTGKSEIISVKTALFREKDGSFRVRILDEKGAEILLTKGFRNPNDARQVVDTLTLLGLESFEIKEIEGKQSLVQSGEVIAVFSDANSNKESGSTRLSARLKKRFVITKRSNGEFQFSLIAGNGFSILVSEGYTDRGACHQAILKAQSSSKDPSKYQRATATNGKFYFNLASENGQIIGTSQMYSDESGRENGILSVIKSAEEAPIYDETIP